MEAPVPACVVGGVDQLVGGDRQTHPGALLGAVVVDDLLVEPVAELVHREAPVGRHVRGQDIDVVDALDRGAAVDVALRHVLEPGAQVLGRDVGVLLEEELKPVPVGVVELVRGPVPVVALVPADTEPGRLDGGGAALKGRGAPGPERRVAQPGQPRLGQLQAVGLVLAPAAQEYRLALAVLDLHTEQVDEEAQAVVGGRGEELGVGNVGDVVDWLGAHVSTFSRRPSRS